MAREHSALVEQYIPLVRSIVGKLKAAGLPPQVEADDLEQAGYVGLIRALSSFNGGIDLTARLSRDIRTYIICEIQAELRHWKKRSKWEDLFDENREPLV
jgi:DNA-directed RNA polymerase specialized sigma subunit